MKRILIVEDDGAIAAIERDYLMLSDFQVDIAATGPEGLAMGRSGGYDLILLDLMLPGLDGFALCSTLRETLDIPILMVTARQEDIDKIKGLGLGADDYITKPFRLPILKKRVEVALRRGTPQDKGDWQGYDDGFLRLDFTALTAVRGGEVLSITPNEYKLLRVLASSPGTVVTRRLLLEKLWDKDGNFIDDHTLTVTVNRLRSKIEDGTHTYIKTVRGMGYIWTGAAA